MHHFKENKMNKLQMAHQMALAIQGTKLIHDMELVSDMAWKYADAMQAEADKRKPIPKLPALQQTFIDGVEQPRYTHGSEEWQPDWSQAPSWANWWAMDGFSKKANWYIDKPYLDDDSKVESEWNIGLKTNTETYMHAPSFNYQGNWQDSLRKRPQ